MLETASDYTYVDVSGIKVEGDILPARDMRGSGAWRALKAEDYAYLLEMIAERRGASPYETPSLVLKRLWYTIVSAAKDNADNVVDAEYEFGEKYDVSSFSPKLAYAGAFNYEPSVKVTEVAGDPYGYYKHRLDANFIRRAYYDFSRKTAFLFPASLANASVSHDNIGSQYNNLDERVDTATTPQSGTYLYGWGSNSIRDNNTCYSCSQDKNNSGTAEVNISNIDIDSKYIEKIIAFVDVTCNMAIGRFPNELMETHQEIIPVSCDKLGGEWKIPNSVFTDATARSALNRYGFPPDPPSVTKTPDDYSGAITEKRVSVYLYVGNAVVYCKFPSDFSGLGWGWKP